jgi:hypothetical protein
MVRLMVLALGLVPRTWGTLGGPGTATQGWRPMTRETAFLVLGADSEAAIGLGRGVS